MKLDEMFAWGCFLLGGFICLFAVFYIPLAIFESSYIWYIKLFLFIGWFMGVMGISGVWWNFNETINTLKTEKSHLRGKK